MKKIAFFLILSFSIQSCGFTPIYVSKDNLNFQIKNITYDGNRDLNNFINIALKKYINKNDVNTSYEISTITKYSKITQSKDTKGNTQSFLIEGSATFIVTGDNQSFKFTYSEQSTLNNSNDTFELNSYENSIKQNFASSMIEKLILDISSKQ